MAVRDLVHHATYPALLPAHPEVLMGGLLEGQAMWARAAAPHGAAVLIFYGPCATPSIEGNGASAPTIRSRAPGGRPSTEGDGSRRISPPHGSNGGRHRGQRWQGRAGAAELACPCRRRQLVYVQLVFIAAGLPYRNLTFTLAHLAFASTFLEIREFSGRRMGAIVHWRRR